MPLGGLSTLFGDILSVQSLILGFLVISTSVSIKRWANGKKNTWERDWAGKMVLIVGKPTPTILHLMHHLLHLAHPPEILYLPPVASPLPQPLLTILHTIRLSASSPLKSSTPSTPGSTDLLTSSSAEPAVISRPAELTCEPLPQNPAAIRDFIRKWTTAVPGVGQEGRRVDVVIWGDGWEVDRGFEVFEGELRRVEKETAELAKRIPPDDNPSVMDETKATFVKPTWTPEEARFHLLTALLPSLLKAPMERSIRLITLVSPFYAAGIPFLPSFSSDAGDAVIARDTHDAKLSPIAASGIKALRTIALWKHLQKVLNALATVSTSSRAPQAGVEVPLDAEDESAAGPAASFGANGQDENESSGVRQRKAFEEHLQSTKKGKNIAVQSNTLALAVAVGIDRSILRTLVGVRSEGVFSAVGWYLYLFFYPVIWLLTPSSRSNIESILHAMSAPVDYPDSDELTDMSEGADGKIKSGKAAGVRGGDIIRDCEAVVVAASVTGMEKYGQGVWEELEKRVEAGVQASSERQVKGASTDLVADNAQPRASSEQEDVLDEDEEWEKLNAADDEIREKDSVY